MYKKKTKSKKTRFNFFNMNFTETTTLTITTNSFIVTSQQLSNVLNETAFNYWNDRVSEQITERKLANALIASVSPFLVTLILLLVGLTITSKLFHLKNKLRRAHADKLILYSDNEGAFKKISVIDEMKRRKIHANYMANHHQQQIHNPNPNDFHLPG